MYGPPSSAPEPASAATKKYAREDADFTVDPADCRAVASERLKCRIHDLERDFVIAELDRKAGDKLRPKLEPMNQKGPVAAPGEPTAAGVSVAEATNIFQMGVTSDLKSCRERILYLVIQVVGPRGKVEQLTGTVKGVRKVPAAVAPPPSRERGRRRPARRRQDCRVGAFDRRRTRAARAVDRHPSEVQSYLPIEAAGGDVEDGEDEDDDAA